MADRPATVQPLGVLDMSPAEIEARFERARRAGTPAWLWPEVTGEEWRAALRRIEAATAAVLAGQVPVLDARDVTTPALCVAAYTSGMGPLLGHWLEMGALRADGATADLLRLHLFHARAREARLRRELGRALELLAGAGIVPTLLKGAHIGREYFPDAAVRPAADLDVVVTPREMAPAARALKAAGYAPGPAQGRPRKQEWIPPDAPVVLRSLYMVHADDPYSIELHASLDRNFFGVRTLRFDDVARGLPGEGRRRWALPAGGPVRVLAQPLLTAYLASHASEGLHQLSLLRVVELVFVIRRDVADGSVDWEQLLDVMRAAGGLRFGWPALALAERLAPGTVPQEVLARMEAEATPAMRAVVGGLTPATAQRIDRVAADERTMWAATPWERVRRAAHALWPAAAGRSPARLAAIYRRRAWVLLRGLSSDRA